MMESAGTQQSGIQQENAPAPTQDPREITKPIELTPAVESTTAVPLEDNMRVCNSLVNSNYQRILSDITLEVTEKRGRA